MSKLNVNVHGRRNENEIIDSNQNSEEEHNALFSKEEENVNILNKSCLEEDILDLTASVKRKKIEVWGK